MINLLLKRIISILVSLAGIILIGFWLTRLVPGDPVQRMMGSTSQGETSKSDFRSAKYDELYRKLNYDLPVFYFTWSNPAVPDSFYYLPQKERRTQLVSLSRETGKPLIAYNFRFALEELEREISLSSDIENQQQLKVNCMLLRQADNSDEIKLLLKDNVWKSKLTTTNYRKSLSLSEELNQPGSLWKSWIPVIGFSFNNQFHYWFTGLLGGNLGNSTVTGQSVLQILLPPLKVTLIISILAIAISIVIAVPLSVILILHREKRFIKIVPSILLFIYTIPLFFLATLLLMLFANPDFFNWFPASGIAPLITNENSSWLDNIPYFILPLVSYTLGTTVFFVRLLQISLEEELKSDHVKTARAKGAGEFAVVAVHALRNSLFPLITSLTTALPAMISGSLLLENIFSIPGMGTEIVRAVQNQDYPVMIAFFLIIGLITILIYNLGDILYSASDPRISKSKMKEEYA